MHYGKIVLAALLAASVAACGAGRPGTATKYRSTYIFGGYSEKQIEPGVWRVIGRSNGIAEEGFGANMAIYRAAELLAGQGFAYVRVLDQKGKRTVRNGYDHMGESMTLTVRGLNGPDESAECRADTATRCMTLPIAMTMARLAPLLHIQPAPAAATLSAR